jgi:endonuclease-3 related protein
MKQKVREIYKKLHKHFGDLGWWPAENNFEVGVGAILTQNTSWHNVERSLYALKKRDLLDPYKIKRISQKSLEKIIRPSGFQTIKSVRLKNICVFLINRYSADFSVMRKQGCKRLREELLGINGVGPETADSILLYAVGKPVFVVDAYTRRIFSRHKIVDFNDAYDKIQFQISGYSSPRVKTFNRFHAYIVETAKQFCKKNNPLCEKCPLSGM